MKSSNLVFRHLFILLFTILIASCATDSILQPTSDNLLPNPQNAKESLIKKNKIPWATVVNDTTFGYGKITINASQPEITPSALYGCDVLRIVGTAVHHYVPKDGKILGIWNYNKSHEELSILKTKWGYSGFFIQQGDVDVYNYVTTTLGINYMNLMVAIGYNVGTTDYIGYINARPAGSYYIDEPAEHGCFGNEGKRLYSPNEFVNVKIAILDRILPNNLRANFCNFRIQKMYAFNGVGVLC